MSAPTVARPALPLLAGVAALHVLGALLLLQAGTSSAVLTGSCGVAYVLGLRHAFDPDHLLAIDNATRRLLKADRSPSAVGFAFSLGHATVVLAATVAILLGGPAVAAVLGDEVSAVRRWGGFVGRSVAGVFLVVLGVLNARIGFAIWAARHALDPADHPAPQGLFARLLHAVGHHLDSAWRMYPVGLLFGLGFDTAASIGLLVAAAASAVGGVPTMALLAVPVLFAAAMTAGDTLNGLAMASAHRWASDHRRTRLTYDLVLTWTSAGLALAVGVPLLVGLIVG